MAKRQVQIEMDSKLSPGAKRAMLRMKQGIKQIGALAKKALNFGKYLAAGAAAAATSLALLVKKSISVGDNLDKMSKRTGLTVEFLVGLGHAADQGGSSMAAMEKAVKKLSQSASDANDGLKTYTRQFDALGISIHDTEGQLKPTEQLFLETADALSKMENNTQKVAVASKIFGRAGTELLPMLTNGRNGLRAMINESKTLGNVWNQKTTTAAADATDAMARVWKIAGNIRDRLSVELIPEVTAAADATRDWFIANKDLISSKVVEFADRLKGAVGGAYEQIAKWQDSGQFVAWWERVRVAATGVWTVITGINAGLAQIADFSAKTLSATSPILGLADTLGLVDTKGLQAATRSYRESAEATADAAGQQFNDATSAAAAAGLRTDQYNERGARSADAMQQAADQAVGAYQAGQDQRLRENSARLRMMGA